MRFAIILSIFFLIFVSCKDTDYIYQQKKSVSYKGWVYADSLQFNFDIKDTSKIYSLLMDIKHTTEFPYQNIYLNISTSFPSGKFLQQKLSSELADKTGKWYGKCSGKECIAPINLQGKAKFNELGKHKITIAQFSRDSALLGISAIELKLKEFKNESK